ncbi:MAG: response regulator [Syntrophobacteraceae bacterium]
MLHILLVTTRREIVHSFAEGLRSDPEVCLDQVSSGAEALSVVRTRSPHLVIVDSDGPATDSLDLVREIISTNAMVNTAVVSMLSDEDFHEKSEGLGILCRLPLQPRKDDSKALLQQLRGILGLLN